MSTLLEAVQSRQLSVGINRADPLSLAADLDSLEAAGVKTLHFDVYDGRYAGPLSGSAELVGRLSGRFSCDVHLMVEDPERHVEPYVAAGAAAITFHPEAAAHPHRVLRTLAGTGVVRGVALSPSLPVETLEPLLGEFELALVLAVNPGLSEPFQPRALQRAAQIRALIGEQGLLSIDGGINLETIDAVATSDCNLVVAGSAVFAGGDPGAAANTFIQALTQPGNRG